MYPAIGIVPANFTLYDGLPCDERGGLVVMSRRFRYWYMDFYLGPAAECEAAAVVIQVALACPNFDYVIPWTMGRKSFARQLELFLDISPYKYFQPRLRRLIGHLQ
ncbi:hypothetical protein FBU31_001912 [Coemansia sp. 'formosensis']|nr:hypothetical protein FBU31_001912 [Coemansia sp. 'formosensis']